jgi:serine/threonine-protein kinase RsbW
MEPEEKNEAGGAETSRDHEKFDVELNIPSDYSLLKLVVDLGTALMDLRGFNSEDQDAARLSIHEALINAIRYGSAGNPKARVVVRYYFEGPCFYTDIEDEGEGFDPDQIPDPTLEENLLKPQGRGIFLLRQLTEKLEVTPLKNKGVRVSFCRYNSKKRNDEKCAD